METGEWCPLFGALPDCTERDGITENCIKVISDARNIFRTYENIPGPQKPAFDSWIKSIRILCMDSHAIISDAQFRTGLYSRSDGLNAQTSGREESYLTFDVDQVSGEMILDTVGTRAGIDADLKRKIKPAQAFALMAIGEAWSSIRWLNHKDSDGKRLKRLAIDRLMRAEKLMKATLTSLLKEKQARVDINSFVAKAKADARWENGKNDISNNNNTIQSKADEIWEKYPTWSKSRVAKKLDDEGYGKMNTIRQIIKKDQNNA
jgi:hypothetical protein